MHNRRAVMRVQVIEGMVVGRHRTRERCGDLAEHGVERGTGGTRRREPGQVVAAMVGGLFVVAGALGVGPGLLDNVVHIGFGVAGLTMSRGARGARAFLIAGGVAYFLLWQFGGVIDPALVPFRTGDVAVHLSFVASMIGIAVLSGGRAAAPLTVAQETGFREVTARFVRRRQAPSRPPGRGDRHTAPGMAAACRRVAVLVGRG